MGGIKAFIIFPVASLYLAVVPWCIGADQLMSDAMLFQMELEEGGFIPAGSKTIRELRAIIRLDALNRAGKRFYEMIHKKGGRIGAVFLKSLYKTPSGILINSGILEELFSDHLTVNKAGRGDKFHIYLDTLAGMIHLLIRLWDILGVRGMDSHNALAF